MTKGEIDQDEGKCESKIFETSSIFNITVRGRIICVSREMNEKCLKKILFRSFEREEK